MINELVSSIKQEMELIGNEFQDFQKQSKAACPPSCCKCCINPDIFCSVSEMLPMAQALFQQGRHEEVLDQINSFEASDKQNCVLLKIDNLEQGKGKCDGYEFRPLICRTFGFSGHRLKEKISLSICKNLDFSVERKQELEAQLNSSDASFPIISVASFRLSSKFPKILQEQFQINQALKLAIEKVILYSKFDSDR